MIQEHKIVVLGCVGTGKCKLITNYVQGVSIEGYDSTIEDSYRKQVIIDGQNLSWIFWTQLGRDILDQYMRAGHGFILVYSITEYDSFEGLMSYWKAILRAKDVGEIPLILVGNNCHLESERVVKKEQAANLAWELNCPYFEASAKTSENISKVRFLNVD